MSDQQAENGEIVSATIDNDSELSAIRLILGALVPLKREGRTRVLDYVLKRLGMQSDPQVGQGPTIAAAEIPSQELPSPRAVDIRSLTKDKAPRSANEMAALVAYYLSEVAPEGIRKSTLTTEDIKKYFKQAPFQLPSRPHQTLTNAKNSGYLESVGGGQYKLNPVGYNLVVHKLPASGASSKPSKPNRRKSKKR